MKKHLFIITTVLLITLLVGYQNQTTKQLTTDTQSIITPIPTTTPSPIPPVATPVPINTTDWIKYTEKGVRYTEGVNNGKTYYKDYKKYSFRYPKNWTINSTTLGGTITDPSKSYTIKFQFNTHKDYGNDEVPQTLSGLQIQAYQEYSATNKNLYENKPNEEDLYDVELGPETYQYLSFYIPITDKEGKIYDEQLIYTAQTILRTISLEN